MENALTVKSEVVDRHNVTTPAITVSAVSKSYRINPTETRSGYQTIRQEMGRWVSSLAAKKKQASTQYDALHDVSFSVNVGEVVGIIGRNGAGKSTLLKILARITSPTRGEVDIYGRLGSLLEIGTGFHPELSGRENIFLSGAILGMSRADIRRRFDEIVDFAEVDRFIDTPCKHYSSGMYMRLAFAVMAHLEADILLIDEVLAVGDSAFQRKCLGKMSEVAGGGRTVIFVSHNMAAVQQLCDRGVVLEKGRMVFCGGIEEAVVAYQDQFQASGEGSFVRGQPGDRTAWICGARLVGRARQTVGTISMSDALEIEIDVESTAAKRLALSLQVREAGQSPLLHTPSADKGQILPTEKGVHRVRLVVPPVMLYPGVYGLRLTLSELAGGTFDVVDQADDLVVTIEQDMEVCSRPLHRQAGVVFVRSHWEYVGRV